MNSSQELFEQDVRDEFEKTRSYFRVARALNTTMEMVKSIIGDTVQPTKRREALFGGQGRPELRKFLVATRTSEQQWDNDEPDIQIARHQYEAGTHEMCTGFDGDTVLLYSIPRASPATPRTNYFQPGNNI
jgi:hypothetical protein